MKKKMWTLLLALCMALSMSSVALAADDGINTEQELKDAVSQGGDIVVTGNITLTSAITVEKTVSINANQDVTIDANSVVDAFRVGQGGKLTLGENVTITSNVGAVLWAHDGGEIIVNGAEIKVEFGEQVKTYDVVCVGASNDANASAKLTIQSGSISGSGADQVTIAAYDKNAVVNIEGGTVFSKDSSAVAAINGATVNISGGTVETKANLAAAYAKAAGSINVSKDAKLTNPAGSATLIAAVDGKVTMSGGTVSSGVLAHESANASATVTGGIVNGGVHAADGADVSLAGGTYAGDIVLTDDITLTAPIIINGETTITASTPVTIKAENVVDAFQVGQGGKLTLGKNVTITSNVGAVLWAHDGGEITVAGAKIDVTFNGEKTYDVVCVGASKDANDSATLTMESGSISGTGADQVTIAAYDKNAVVNIKGGTVSSANSSAVAAINGATVNISGGTVETKANLAAAYAKAAGSINVSKDAKLTNPAGSATLIAAVDGKVTMSGGTVSSGVLAHESANASAEIKGGTINGTVKAANGATMEIAGGTINLTGAVIVEGTMNISADNAMTIAAGNIVDAFQVGQGGKLTLGKNVTITSNVGAVLWAHDGGEIIVNGANIEVAFNGEKTYDVVCVGASKDAEASATLTMESGSISGTGADQVTIAAYDKNAVVNIKGGTVSSANSSAVAAINGATVNISGGTVETEANLAAAYAKKDGSINVSGDAELISPAGYTTLIAAVDGNVTMSGGTVSGGVLAHENANAKAEITGGTINGTVSAANGATMTISGGVFSDLTGENYVIAGYTLVKDEAQGGYVLVPECTVIFDVNGGTGTMTSVVVAKGSTYQLPECSFTAPTDYLFNAWSVNGVLKAVGEAITVNDDITVTAMWVHDHDFADATCTAPKTCTCNVTEGEALGHTTTLINAKEATCGQKGYTGDVYCDRCKTVLSKGTEIAATDSHYYNDWTIIKNPTATEEGAKAHTCVYCGRYEKVAISKTSASVTTGTATGDNSPLALLVGLVVAAGMFAVVADKKRRFQ